MNPSDPDSTDVARLPLSILLKKCQEQIRLVQENKAEENQQDICIEIVRRAAKCDQEALGILMNDISRPMIDSRCPLFPDFDREDFIQNVMVQMLAKFYDPKSPFVAKTFPAYRVYLYTTIKSILFRMNKVEQRYHPGDFDEIQESSPAKFMVEQEDKLGQEEEQKERESLAQYCLDSLRDKPEELAVVYHRFILGENIKEVVTALQSTFPGLTVRDVYKHLASAMRRMKKLPRIGKGC